MEGQAVIEIRVEGRVAPKGSRLTGVSKTGNTYTYPASRFEKPWIDAVKKATQVVMRHHDLPAAPYSVDLEIVVVNPIHARYSYPVRGDIDKLARSTLDGLVQGGGISDDAHVTVLTVIKRYADGDETPGVYARIKSLAASAALAA